MISIYQLKPAFQSLLRPIVKALAKSGVTPNQVTLFACLLSIILGCLLWTNPHNKLLYGIIPFFMFFRMALNAVDGLLAKEHGMKTKLGAILNELTDVIADSALFLPFMNTLNVNHLAVITFVLLAVISEMTGILGSTFGASRRYDGPMGKSDRAFVFGVLAILISCSIEIPENIMNAILAVLILLVSFTIFNRAKGALKEASHV